MRENKYTGEVFLPLAGEGDAALRFTWRGIAALRTRWGDDWEVKFRKTLNAGDTEGIAFLLATAAGYDEAYWLDKSPPLLPACEALNRALDICFLGAGGLPTRPQEVLQLLTRFWRGTGDGSGSEVTANNSGS